MRQRKTIRKTEVLSFLFLLILIAPMANSAAIDDIFNEDAVPAIKFD
jgi:hypothetical protein